MRISKWIIFIILLLVGVSFINNLVKVNYCGFHKLDNDSVEKVIMYKFLRNDIMQNHHIDSLIFTNKQKEKFVHKWNYTYPIGPCKYIPTFTLTTIMNNGSKRDFRINGNTIKETNDFGYKIPLDNKFFEEI